MNNIVQMEVNCQEKRAYRINPFIFGHFVEDIRDHMDAMLAYVLKDMDFEQEDTNNDGVAGCWYPVTNGKNTKYAVEPAAPQHSGNSQKIRIFSNDQCYAAIGQKIALKGNVNYEVKVYARASLQITEATVEVIDRCSRSNLGQHTFTITDHDWKEYSFLVYISEDCEEAELRIGISSEGQSWQDTATSGYFWIDHISLLSEERVGIVKKEVFDMTKALNCGIMRLGGNDISAYHWKYGVGPVYRRPNRSNEAWEGWMANKYFGTDEFLQFCEALEVESMICVNAGSGTPEEAAKWVEYCNGDVNTPMGAWRAKNGHPEPYGVKYWEIGNEIFGAWQVGHCSGEEFAKRYVGFAKAMKEVDPSIILLGCGHIGVDWAKPVIENAGEFMDYLTLHIYHSYSNGFNNFGIRPNAPREERFKGVVAYPEVVRYILKQITDIIKSNPKHSHVKLAITEHNTMYHPNTVRSGMPEEHTLEAAVANAMNFHEYMRNGEMVEIANYSDLVNGWLGGCIRVGDNFADQVKGKLPGWSRNNLTVYGTPTYHLMKLYANLDIAHIVDSMVACDTFETITNNKELDLKNLPIVDTVSCMNEEGNKLTILAVNRSLKSQEAVININDFMADSKAKVRYLTAESIDDLNSVFDPEKIVEQSDETELKSNKITYMLKAHSIYVFEVEGAIRQK